MEEQEKELLSKVYYDDLDNYVAKVINAKSELDKKSAAKLIRRQVIDEEYKPHNINDKEIFDSIRPWYYLQLENDVINSIDKYEIKPLSKPETESLAYRKNTINFTFLHRFYVQKILVKENASMEAVTAGGLHDHVEDEKKLNPNMDPTWFINILVEPWQSFSGQIKEFNSYSLENIVTRLSKPETLEYKKYVSQIFQSKEDKPSLPLGLVDDAKYILDIFRKDISKEEENTNILRSAQVKFADRTHITQTKKLPRPKGVFEFSFAAWGTVLASQEDYEPLLNGENYSLEEMLRHIDSNEERFMEEYYPYSGEIISSVMEPSFVMKKVYKNIIFLSHYNRFVENLEKDGIDISKGELKVANRMKQKLLDITTGEIDAHLEFLLNYNEVDISETKLLLNEALEYKEKGGYKTITLEAETNSEYKFDGTVINIFEKLLNLHMYNDAQELRKSINAPQKSMFDRKDRKRGIGYRLEEFKLLLDLKYMLEEFREDPKFYYNQLTIEGLIEPERPIM
ncbi:hypothetical protein GOV08_00315 [Candidatus Woesearchaeota archaeon]|nr:hypothetical protein [Candidatus Woesearchaeota archaeon]